MTRIRLDYIHQYVDRHGKIRRYFRRPGYSAQWSVANEIPKHSNAGLGLS